MKIKYCAKNLKAYDTKPVYKSVKNEYPDLKHKKEECLGRCKTCKHECFALIGKTTIVTAPTPKKLRKKIREAIG